MTITVVQSVQINNTYSGNFSSAVTTGNSIVMAVTGRNVGNTITTSNPQYNGGSVTGAVKLIDQQDTGSLGSTYVAIWLLPNVQSSGTSLSITTNSTPANFVGIEGYEVSGLGSNPTLDKSSSNTGSGATDQNSGASGNITQAPEFVVGLVCQDQTLGSGYPPAGWTSQNGATGNSVTGYQIPVSSGSSFNYDVGIGNANWTAAVATIFAGSGATSGTVQPRATVPVPRRYRARAVWAGSKPFTGFVAVAAPPQEPRTLPRRTAARAVWHGSAPFTGFVAVAAPPRLPPVPRRTSARAVWAGQAVPPRIGTAPRQLPPIPRRTAARAVIQFTPVTTTNAAPVIPTVAGALPVLTVNRTEVMSRTTGRVVRR